MSKSVALSLVMFLMCLFWCSLKAQDGKTNSESHSSLTEKDIREIVRIENNMTRENNLGSILVEVFI